MLRGKVVVGKTKQIALMIQSNGCGWFRHSLSGYKERLLRLTLSQGDPTLASFPNVAALGPDQMSLMNILFWNSCVGKDDNFKGEAAENKESCFSIHNDRSRK